MRYIKLKQVIAGGYRQNKVFMSGFEGLIPNTIMEHGLAAMAGTQLKTRFQMTVEANGDCEALDTEHNRALIRSMTKPYKPLRRLLPGEAEPELCPAEFILVENVDINAPAGEGYADGNKASTAIPEGFTLVPNDEWEMVKKKLKIGNQKPDRKTAAALQAQSDIANDVTSQIDDGENTNAPDDEKPETTEPLSPAPIVKGTGSQKQKNDAILASPPDEV